MMNLCGSLSNPDPLDFAHAHVIVAPIIKTRRFRVRVTGHLLRNLDAPPVAEVIRNPRGAKSVAAGSELCRAGRH